MKIRIETETKLNPGDNAYYLHIDETSKKYSAAFSVISKIIVDIKDSSNFMIYYLLTNGKLLPYTDAFALESDMWNRYSSLTNKTK